MFNSPKKGSFAKRMYLPRLIGSGVGFWAIAPALTPLSVPAWVWALLVFNAYIWPHLAFLLASRVDVPYVVERRNLLIEACWVDFGLRRWDLTPYQPP